MTDFIATYDGLGTLAAGAQGNGDSNIATITNGGGTIAGSTAEEAHGTHSALFTPSGTNACHIQYTDGADTQSGIIAIYVRMPASPSATIDFPIRIVNSLSSTLVTIQMTSTRILRISAGTSVQGAVALALNAFYRVQLRYSALTTSPVLNCEAYLGDSTTLHDSMSLTPAALGTQARGFRLGKLSASTLTSWYIDSMRIRTGNNADLGPWVVAPEIITITDNVGVSDSGEIHISQFAGVDLVGITDFLTVINATTQDADTSPYPVVLGAFGTPIDNSYVIIADALSPPIKVGTKFRIYNSGGSLKEATIFTVTDNSVFGSGFRNIFVTPNFATTAVSGDIIKTDTHEIIGTASATKTASAVATQTVTGTQAASATVTRNAPVDQLITLTQAASVSITRNADATQAATATGVAAGIDIANAAAAQAVTATLTAVAVDIANGDATQTLTGSQSAAATKTGAGSSTQTLTATGTASASVSRDGNAVQSAVATGTAAATKTATAAATQAITATQSASAAPIQSTSADVCNLTAAMLASASVTRVAAATQTLTATQAASAFVSRDANASQTLTATGTSTAGSVPGADGVPQILTASATASATRTRNADTVGNLVVTQAASASIVRAAVATGTMTATSSGVASKTQNADATPQTILGTQNAVANPVRVAATTLALTATQAGVANATRAAAATLEATVGGSATANMTGVTGATQQLDLQADAGTEGSAFINTSQLLSATLAATANTGRQASIGQQSVVATQSASASVVRNATASQAVSAFINNDAIGIRNVNVAVHALTATFDADGVAYTENEGEAVQLVIAQELASATIVRSADAEQGMIATQLAGAVKTKFVQASQSLTLVQNAEAYRGAIDEDSYFKADFVLVDLMPQVGIDMGEIDG